MSSSIPWLTAVAVVLRLCAFALIWFLVAASIQWVFSVKQAGAVLQNGLVLLSSWILSPALGAAGSVFVFQMVKRANERTGYIWFVFLTAGATVLLPVINLSMAYVGMSEAPTLKDIFYTILQGFAMFVGAWLTRPSPN